jgi:hypothetical protein
VEGTADHILWATTSQAAHLYFWRTPGRAQALAALRDPGPTR